MTQNEKKAAPEGTTSNTLNDTDYVQGTFPLTDAHRSFLHSYAITDEVIEAAGIRSSDLGWVMRWQDEANPDFAVGVFDRDKRPASGQKNTWEKDRTTHLNMLRMVPTDKVLLVEGIKQHLAAASHAPAEFSVIGMNGCDGVHAKTELAWAKGKQISVIFDADRLSNQRVKGASERVTDLLRKAGAASVTLVDIPGKGSDGLDDVLADVLPERRAAKLASWLDTVPQGEQHPRTQAILAAAYDAADLDSLPEPTPLLEGRLNVGEYVLLAGKFGTYKSFVALAWAYSLATGVAWGSHEVPEARPVVYIAAEGVSGIRKRLRALEKRYGVKVPAGMLTVIVRPVRLANKEELEGLRAVVADRKAALLVLDTWHRMTPGVEENSATDTGGALDAALQIRDDYGATVLVVHHTGHKQQHARGSSSLEDDADATWLIRLGEGEEAEDRGPNTPRTLVHRKSKDGELADPVRLDLQVDDAGEATVSVNPFTIANAGVPLRKGRPSQADKHESAVLELIEALDGAGMPVDMGWRAIADWDVTRRPGRVATQRVHKEVAAARKAKGGSAGHSPKGECDPTRPPNPRVSNGSETPDPLSPAETSRGSRGSETAGRVSDPVPGTGGSESVSDPLPPRFNPFSARK